MNTKATKHTKHSTLARPSPSVHLLRPFQSEDPVVETVVSGRRPPQPIQFLPVLSPKDWQEHPWTSRPDEGMLLPSIQGPIERISDPSENDGEDITCAAALVATKLKHK